MAEGLLTRRRFTVDEYHCMGEAGILHEDERVELIEGEILQMAPIGGRHIACVNRLNRGFDRRVGDTAVVSVQNPVRLSPGSEPEPDIALLRFRADFYATLPEPADVLLIVEVADTSLEYDRRIKLPLYAAAGIPEVWIVDLEREHVEVYRTPGAAGYGHHVVHRRGEALIPVALPSIQIRVDEILG